MPAPELDYLREKFYLAVRSLAIGRGDARERLENAYYSLMMLEPSDLPSPMRRRFRTVMRRLTKSEPRTRAEGRVHASVSQMQKRTAASLAKIIFDLYDELNEPED